MVRRSSDHFGCFVSTRREQVGCQAATWKTYNKERGGRCIISEISNQDLFESFSGGSTSRGVVGRKDRGQV